MEPIIEKSTTEEQKTVLITGALGLTGRVLCRAFKMAGFFVIAADRESGVCDCNYFVRVDTCHLLLKEPPLVLCDFVAKALTGRRLNLVVHNAAVDRESPMQSVSAETFTDLLNCNVIAPLLLTRVLFDSLLSPNGMVIFTTLSCRQAHMRQRSEYVASKMAVEGLVAALGEEFRDTLRVFGVGASPRSVADKTDNPDEFAKRIAEACLRIIESPDFARSGSVLYV